MFIVRTVPVLTEYNSSKIGSPSESVTVFPCSSFFFTQFFRSSPIPPVTPTVVRKIGEIPLVPAIIGAIFMNGTKELACLPIHRATLFTPDILDDPTPIVPFSAISIIVLSGCFSFKAKSSFCRSTLCSNIHLPCNSLSDLEWASLPGDNKSVDISPTPAMYVTTFISCSIGGSLVKNSAFA